MTNRRKSAPPAAALDINCDCKEQLVQYLTDAFPTRQMEVFKDSSGELRSRPATDKRGNPVLCQEAVRTRDALIEKLCAMPPVPSALDELIRHFGPDRVAEVTGRTRRIITDKTGRQKVERLSPLFRIAETEAFQNGEKDILVFSVAGGTGRSYHADRNCPSAHKRRVHYLLEPGWRAMVAIQGLGRTHRTNQLTAPIFRPVTTDCWGERRFISTIARRLDALGALTRGQRQAGSQNLFDPSDNLESDYAKDALRQWYGLLADGKLASTGLADFEKMTGLKLTYGDSGELLERLPPIQRWLNRLLALRIATQNAIFGEFFGLIQTRVDAAREAGTLDLGVETIVARNVEMLFDIVIHRDELSGAETRLQKLRLQRKPSVTIFERLMRIWNETDDVAFLRNNRSGRVALRVPSWSTLDEDGAITMMCKLVRPTGEDRIGLESLARSHWQRIDRDLFEQLWLEEAAKALDEIDIETVHIATGLLLPTWDKLPQDTYHYLFGLLAATGLRISEALALQCNDLVEEGLVIRNGKFGKLRLIALQPSTRQALEAYLAIRDRLGARGSDLFVSIRGRAPTTTRAHVVFVRLARQLGFRGPTGTAGMRLHDLRHTFAVRSLESCSPDRQAVAHHMAGLSVYLGHVSVANTYWYLEATPVLLRDIAAASENLYLGEAA